MKCKVCGNEIGNVIHKVPERIINNGAFFDYLECGRCRSWVLEDDVDVSEWYPKTYNVYERRVAKRDDLCDLIPKICDAEYEDFHKVSQIDNLDMQFKRLCGTKITHKSKILDVGCANGSWLDALAQIGYENVTGVDLYVPDDRIHNSAKWRFIKGDIFSIDDNGYDLITFNHSLEHMKTPLLILKKVYDLLVSNGLCEISIPLANGEAHAMFGEFFCQLDAPRHLFIFDKIAFIHICESVGFSVEYVNFESNGLIYSISEGYMLTQKSHGELMNEAIVSEEYKKKAQKSNNCGNGDQAIFYLRKGRKQ